MNRQRDSQIVQDMLATALGYHQAGRLTEAERLYRQTLAIDGCHADTLHLLGMIAYQHGLHDAAAETILQAIAIDNRQAPYHSNLGAVLQAQGKLDEAAACYERALALNPGLPEIHVNFGNILQAQGKLDEAVACQERALALNPDCAEAFYNLGNVLQTQRKLDEAVACYQRALALKPDYAEAHNNVGVILTERGKREDAVAHCERAIALKPDYAYAYNNLANALAGQDRVDDAVAHYERALVLDPDYADAHNNLGSVFKEQGKFDEAMAHFGRAIAIRPDFAEAHFNRAEIESFHPGDADLAALEALADRDDLAPNQAVYIHFALAKALEDSGDTVRAFEHFGKGNALKRRQVTYDEPEVLKRFRRIATVFDRSLFDRFEGAGDPSSVPVFVLGMPRSGSTLVEQILASHPQIHGAGELMALEVLASSLSDYPECVPALDGLDLRRLGQSYLALLPPVEDGKIRIVDKLPGNFLSVGLIRLILPNAKIIHTVRYPVDTCVSCYSKLFTFGLNFSYDLGELGRYYRSYSELMAHWRAVLPPGAMLEVAYEDVVDDLEVQARRLIEYCGVPWDNRCIDFHKNSRQVKTASAVQIRKPLFRSSLQRWRRYEAQIGPLLDELGSLLDGNVDRVSGI